MIGFKGFEEKILTFKSTDCVVGQPVTLDVNGNAKKSGDGDEFLGVCVNTSNGYAGVQVKGYCEVKYTTGEPKYGNVYLAADGNGTVKFVVTGKRTVQVVALDRLSRKIGFIF